MRERHLHVFDEVWEEYERRRETVQHPVSYLPAALLRRSLEVAEQAKTAALADTQRLEVLAAGAEGRKHIAKMTQMMAYKHKVAKPVSDMSSTSGYIDDRYQQTSYYAKWAALEEAMLDSEVV